MCSKVSEAKIRSPAAYLLFYRRRSDKPLGPEYLQNLVTDFRNPSQNESGAEDADEAGAGEGQLGGPSRHGSSSALTVAGAGTSANPRSSASGDGPGADSLPTQRGMTTTGQGSEAEDGNGDGTRDARREIGYGSRGGEMWGFGALDEEPADGDDTEKLLQTSDQTHDDDIRSTIVEGDSGVDLELDERRGDFEEEEGSDMLMFEDCGAGRVTPVRQSTEEEEYRDDHTQYSIHARSYDGRDEYDTFHVEDAGEIGDSQGRTPSVVEIHPDDDDEKMVASGLEMD